MTYILSIDQGTTSSRAIIFNADFKPVASAQKEFTQHFPADGMVEHDAEEIWESVLETCSQAIETANIQPSQIAGIGITNQRETTVIWDKTTGKPIHNAIVWQDRRTADLCNTLKAAGHEKTITEKTGLLLDPYFSATKIKWLLDNTEGTRDNTNLLCGTIDTWILWKLTGGTSHKTDATNASRTLLYNIHKGEWDTDLLTLFDIPEHILPTVHDCAHDFGTTELFGAPIPILGIAGDQHAATIGQACFTPGMIKSTYGTGCFVMLNTGETAVQSNNRLLTTIAYQLDGKPTYALEGSIFIAGAAVQWLRDGLKIIDNANETDTLAPLADDTQNIILIPAFAGLGAPYWQPDTRGALYGLTRNTGKNEITKAALESVCFQTRDLIEAMKNDWPELNDMTLRVDGGMCASNWTMQFLSNILNAPIDRPDILETTALGAAWLAGVKAGVWPNQDGFTKSWHLNTRFEPTMDKGTRSTRYEQWLRAVESTIKVTT